MKMIKTSTPTPASGVTDLMRNLCAEGSQESDHLRDALDHHLASGGKRTRANTCLACADSLKISRHDSIHLATAVECVHNASLVQDDYQDRSTLRRGCPSVWKAFDEHTALCLTDLLLSAAFTAVAGTSTPERTPELTRHLHKAVSKTLRGQMRDTSKAHGSKSRLDVCLEVAESKSVPFLAIGLELPLLFSRNTKHLHIAADAARHFGIGYQTIDDLEDLEQDEQEGNEHNIVLAFGEPGAATPPVKQAASIAIEHLETARTLAHLLPKGCGTFLAEQARVLIHRVRELA